MRTLLMLTTLLITACGGGGGGSPSPQNPTPPAPTPPVTDADFGGLWSGTLSYPNQTFEEIVGFTTADGRFVLVSLDTFGPDTFGQYVGTVDIDGDQLTGSGSAYAALGSMWADGSRVAALTMTGTIDERVALSVELDAGSAMSGTVEFDYDAAAHERPASLMLLEGVWYVYDDLTNPIATFTFETDGSFLGQNVNGCQSTGQVSVVAADRNVYSWESTIANCPIAGSYTGLGAIGDSDPSDPANATNDVFVAALASDTRALVLPLQR